MKAQLLEENEPLASKWIRLSRLPPKAGIFGRASRPCAKDAPILVQSARQRSIVRSLPSHGG
jgi:hypothetical protein